MHDEQDVMVQGTHAIVVAEETPINLDGCIAAWLEVKARRTNSVRTEARYVEVMRSFRTALHQLDLDLDSPNTAALALAAQGWAGQRWDDDTRPLSPATINQRLAIISSFYTYARKTGVLVRDNPISRVERGKSMRYAGAVPLDYSQVQQQLRKIDRSTLMGKRDYALLLIGVSTGRRLSELANLRGEDVRISGATITLTFRRCKGAKQLADTLPPSVAGALLDYLDAVYGSQATFLPKEAAIWVSQSRRNPGQALGIQSIADICARHLGVSKVHALRHTFAKLMMDAGAPITTIQAKLGHDSLETTGYYLHALASADNPYGGRLEALLGLSDRLE